MALAPQSVAEALARIAPFVHRTPVVESALLNRWLGHRILFKAECLQKIGAFKARGAMNALLQLKEQGELPVQVAAYSSGNHAQAVAWAAQLLGIRATIFIPRTASALKIQATRGYGAEVVLAQNRQEAEALAAQAEAQGAYVLPPYDHDGVIAGQGTACLELLEDGWQPDAIFAPCGGGGLLSGTWLAAQLKRPQMKVFGGEPLAANDAARSVREGKIVRFDSAPSTIADGVVTLAVAERTFAYLQKLDGILEVSEEAIVYWTQWITHLLKLAIEPTSAVGMAAAVQWLATQDAPRTVAIILSGGNCGAEAARRIWETDYLTQPPSLTH
ncbi:MAG: serine/threonine dehydratase [Alphaproteobacteria bacterium]